MGGFPQPGATSSPAHAVGFVGPYAQAGAGSAARGGAAGSLALLGAAGVSKPTDPVPTGMGGAIAAVSALQSVGGASGSTDRGGADPVATSAGAGQIASGGNGGTQSAFHGAGATMVNGSGGVAGAGSTVTSGLWNLLLYLCPDRANRSRDWNEVEASLAGVHGLDVFTLAETAGEPTRLRHATTPDPSASAGAASVGSSNVDVSVLGLGGPNLDLGNPAVLDAFLEYAARVSPERRTALVVSGIAARKDGLWSLCSDTTSLALSGLQGALEGKGLELLALDGGKVFELAMTYQLRHTADFLVSSQALDFSDFVGAWTSTSERTGRSLAQAIVNTHDTGVLGVVSALETQHMAGLGEALDTLSDALLQRSAADIEALRPDACPGNYAQVQAVDLHVLASLLQPPQQTVMDAVDRAVVAHDALDATGHNPSPAYGVAIYLPLTSGTELNGYTGDNYDLLASPHRYRDFLEWFLTELE